MAQVNSETQTNCDKSHNSNGTTKSENIQDDCWYPDSGATNHITNNLDNLNLGNKEDRGKQSICMENGKCIKITHIGNAYIKDKKQPFLYNLLRVPKIKKNIISVSQFANDNKVYFEFYPKYCLIRDILNKDILLLGDAEKGLYKFKTVNLCSDNQKSCNLCEEQDSKNVFDVWHYKLGHPTVKVVKQVFNENNLLIIFHCFMYVHIAKWARVIS